MFVRTQLWTRDTRSQFCESVRSQGLHRAELNALLRCLSGDAERFRNFNRKMARYKLQLLGDILLDPTRTTRPHSYY
ncbi:hypothetical protein J6590_065990 [Homalodisca vitripennis]|nr:hypothetical protein J6590_065990 [Homalodisca vitripennis]